MQNVLRLFQHIFKNTVSFLNIFGVLISVYLICYVNAWAFEIMLPMHLGSITWLGIVATNLPWFIPCCYVFHMRNIRYVRGLLAQNKFSINWDAKKSAEEYVALLKEQVPERFKET